MIVSILMLYTLELVSFRSSTKSALMIVFSILKSYIVFHKHFNRAMDLLTKDPDIGVPSLAVFRCTDILPTMCHVH